MYCQVVLFCYYKNMFVCTYTCVYLGNVPTVFDFIVVVVFYGFEKLNIKYTM